jgi:hypothetical protein
MKVKRILIHHSASVDGKIQNCGQIRRYHMVNRGWDAIGYHYILELVEYDYEIMIGRFEDEQGAHCPEGNNNREALGVCLVGNFEKYPVPPRQWQPALKLVRQLLTNHNLTPEDVYGHRDFKNTACPGRYFDMKLFRNEL